MIQRHKTITLTPFHPTNGGMNAYKNFPNGQRRILSNDNRFTPAVVGEGKEDWEPIYGVSANCSEVKNGVPGVFGESFNIDNIPTQVITNGVVDMPTNMYLVAPDTAKIWKPGSLLVLIPKSNSGWQIAHYEPTVQTTAGLETKYVNQQVGVLLKPLEWKDISGSIKPTKPTVEVLVGYSKIPRKMSNTQAVKAAPLATPKVATK